QLQPFADTNIPIIGLEPSCLLTLRDDYPSLLPSDSTLSTPFLTLDEFLAKEAETPEFPSRFKHHPQKVLVHGHCYQKSLIGMPSTLKFLNSIQGLDVELTPSGCCGMAGSFGYESEHEPLSMHIGELPLFPAVRNAPPDTLIIASGIS